MRAVTSQRIYCISSIPRPPFRQRGTKPWETACNQQFHTRYLPPKLRRPSSEPDKKGKAFSFHISCADILLASKAFNSCWQPSVAEPISLNSACHSATRSPMEQPSSMPDISHWDGA